MLKFKEDGYLEEGTYTFEGVDFEVRVEKILPVGLTNVRTLKAYEPIGVTIHNTGNPTATAMNHYSYFNRLEIEDIEYVGVPFFIDGKTIVQLSPLCEVTYHAGTSEGNYNYVGLEICEIGDVDKAETIAAYLAASILVHLDEYKITKHQDFNGKYCPRIILKEGRWDEYKFRIKNIVDGYTDLEHWMLEGYEYMGGKGFIEPDYWASRLTKPMPAWAVLQIFKNVIEGLELAPNKKGGE